MKAMRALHSVLLATILFLELIHKLVQFGKLSPLTSYFFFSTDVQIIPDHCPQFVALSHESCTVKIGIFHCFTPVACYLYHRL